MTSAPDPEAGHPRWLGQVALWALRVALVGMAGLCFVLPDPDLTQIDLAWCWYGVGVFFVGFCWATFALDTSADVVLAGLGLWAALVIFGLCCLLRPEETLRHADLFTDPAETTREPGLSDVYFGGVISLVIAAVPIVWWLANLVDLTPLMAKVRLPQRRRPKPAESLFDDVDGGPGEQHR